MRAQLEQELSRLDGFTLSCRDPFDDTIRGGVHFVLHFHRFDDHERLASGHALSLLDEHAHDSARHRRSDRGGASRIPSLHCERLGDRGLLSGLDLDLCDDARRGGGTHRAGRAEKDRTMGRRVAGQLHAPRSVWSRHHAVPPPVDANVERFGFGRDLDLDLMVDSIDANPKSLESHGARD